MNLEHQLTEIEKNFSIPSTENYNNNPIILEFSNYFYRLELINFLQRLKININDFELLRRVERFLDQIEQLNFETKKRIDSIIVGNEKISMDSNGLISIYESLKMFSGNEIKIFRIRAQIRAIDNFFNIFENQQRR